MMQRVFRSLPTRAAPLVIRSSLPSAPRVSFALVAQSRTMADMTPVFTEKAAKPAGPYSQAMKTPTAIYCSGQIPYDAQGNPVEGSIGKKTEACITNLKHVLEEAGSSVSKIVKVNIFLADMNDFAAMNEEYEKWMTHKPARSCVAVKTLPKNVEVEIECIALP